MSKEGYVLKRMLLEKGKHVMQAGIRSGLVVEPFAASRQARQWQMLRGALGLVVVSVGSVFVFWLCSGRAQSYTNRTWYSVHGRIVPGVVYRVVYDVSARATLIW